MYAHRVACLSALIWALAACEEADSIVQNSPDPDTSEDSGPPADAATEPETVELPGGYVPGVDCGELGKSCVLHEECGSGAQCAARCIPTREVGMVEGMGCTPGSCPPEAPVCLSGTCLTRDELACVCTRVDARSFFNECGDVERGGLSCISEGGLCDGSPESCCEGTTCLAGEGLLGTCQIPCEVDDDCRTTACCAESDAVAGRFCASTPFCLLECAGVGEDCTGEGLRCCQGLLCSQSTQPDLDGCRERCDVPGDCDSGCCRLFDGRDFGICTDASQCPDA